MAGRPPRPRTVSGPRSAASSSAPGVRSPRASFPNSEPRLLPATGLLRIIPANDDALQLDAGLLAFDGAGLPAGAAWFHEADGPGVTFRDGSAGWRLEAGLSGIAQQVSRLVLVLSVLSGKAVGSPSCRLAFTGGEIVLRPPVAISGPGLALAGLWRRDGGWLLRQIHVPMVARALPGMRDVIHLIGKSC